MKQGYRTIMHHRCFMQNLIANLINRLGDSIDMIAFSWLVYALTNSAGWSAIVLGVNILPNILIQPIAGAIVEQQPKKRVMVLCDLGRGCLTGLIILLYINHVLQPWILLVITFLNNTLESFRNPAQTGFIPRILPKEDYDFGLSLNQSSARIFELIGTGLAGVILSIGGIAGAVAIDMITFFLSAAIIATIPLEEAKSEKKATVRLQFQTYLHDLKDGYRYLKGTKILFTLALLACLMNMTLVPLNSFEAPYISGILHAPAYMLSLLSIMMTIGIGVGSFLYPYAHKRFSNHKLLAFGGMMTGVYYIALTMIPAISNIDLTGVCIGLSSFLFGLFAGVMISLVNIAFMSRVDTAYVSRASSILSAIATAGMPVLSFILSGVCVFASVLDILFVTGLFTIALFAGMMFMKSLNAL